MRNKTTINQLSFLDNKYTIAIEDGLVYLKEDTGWYVIWTSYTVYNKGILRDVENKMRLIAQQMCWHIIGADDALAQLHSEFPTMNFGHDIRTRHLLNKGQ